MTSVIIAANPKDQELWERFREALDNHFSVICAYGQKLEATCDSAQFLITDAQSYQNVVSDNALMIFRDIQEFDMELITQTPIVAVVDSCNKKLLPFVSSTKLPAITCGLSSTDTVTLSSIGEENAVINLQRSVSCLDGSMAEPQEIPVQLSRNIDNFLLMAVATVFILTGNIDKLMTSTL